MNDKSILGCYSAQDRFIQKENLKTSSLVVVLIPHANWMSGGIHSMFTIARNSRKIIRDTVLVMTRPNRENLTYVKQTHFKNHEKVFRFEQIVLFTKLKKLLLHIPEETCGKYFYPLLSDEIKNFLKEIDYIHINILNQNIRLMPPPEELVDLYKITPYITQTVAHEKYCCQEFADNYNLPTSLLLHRAIVGRHPYKRFARKKNIICYSPDKVNMKEKILKKISLELPNYKLVEIHDMTFEYFLKLVKNSKFMITFGEGMDGYYSHCVMSGGVAFAVYNEEFFPDESYRSRKNIFNDYDDMYENIVDEINYFEKVREIIIDREISINENSKKWKGIQQNDFLAELKDQLKYLDKLFHNNQKLEKFYNNDFDFMPKVQNSKQEFLNFTLKEKGANV
jgi:hypothetical protein